MIITSTISTKNFFINAHENINLSDDRKKLLSEISQEIVKEYHKEGIVNLNFICTHNSRRKSIESSMGLFCSRLL
jgi:arsenate reductase